MFKHYCVIAFRNLLKYKQQTVISLIGLTVGFVCFALSAYWIRYEMSFDAFHSRADRIYQVRVIGENGNINVNLGYPLAQRLETHFPELKATAVSYTSFDLDTIENAPVVRILRADNRFFEIFDVEFVQGLFDINDENGVWVTERFAKKHFKSSSPVGKELVCYGGQGEKRYTVRGMVKDWPGNTNLQFDVLIPADREELVNWSSITATVYVQTGSADRADSLLKRLEEFQVPEQVKVFRKYSHILVPLRKVYYTEPVSNEGALSFNQVVLFAGLGLLVVVCSLFNYLNLYASRIRMRTRELSLRKVNGSSSGQIFGLLLVEFGLLLLIALTVGFLCIEWLLPLFKRYADIGSDRISIYGELLLYVLLLILVSLLGAFLVVVYVRRRVFQESLRQVAASKAGGWFARTGLLLQLIIGIGFIFCVVVYLKQIYTLNTASGMERQNVLTVRLHQSGAYTFGENKGVITLLADALKGESSVEAILNQQDFPRRKLAKINETVSDEEALNVVEFQVNAAYISFYGLQLLAGHDFKEGIQDKEIQNVILNETAVKGLGLKEPIGQIFYDDMPVFYKSDGTAVKYPYEKMACRVIGVVKDFVYNSPLVPVSPVMIRNYDVFNNLAVKYKPGQETQAKEAIERLTKERCPGYVAQISILEQEYGKLFEKEAALQFLLTLLSGVCVIISLFGIYSMVSLASEQRRKEMAVRKVNGASLRAIFGLFLKEYLVLLVVSAAIAYPLGYLMMKPWLEKFAIQTTVGVWLYLSFFLSVGLVIVLTVIARVWRTAHISPVTELKKE